MAKSLTKNTPRREVRSARTGLESLEKIRGRLLSLGVSILCRTERWPPYFNLQCVGLWNHDKIGSKRLPPIFFDCSYTEPLVGSPTSTEPKQDLLTLVMFVEAMNGLERRFQLGREPGI